MTGRMVKGTTMFFFQVFYGIDHVNLCRTSISRKFSVLSAFIQNVTIKSTKVVNDLVSHWLWECCWQHTLRNQFIHGKIDMNQYWKVLSLSALTHITISYFVLTQRKELLFFYVFSVWRPHTLSITNYFQSNVCLSEQTDFLKYSGV